VRWVVIGLGLLLGGGVLAAERAPTDMIGVAAGCVTLGPAKSAGPYLRREVCLPAFRLDRHEVTVAAYRACVKAGGCRPVAPGDARCNANRKGREQHPANCVGWDDASAFCRWRGARLPSEDEWERAARGAAVTTYPWGDARPTPKRVALHDPDASGEEGTSPVCGHPAGDSVERFCDLAGNVAEWVAGYWDRSAEQAPVPEATDPAARKRGARALRGGSIASSTLKMRGWERQYVTLTAAASPAHGFRCAADAPAPSAASAPSAPYSK
jgi:formylglycine-generating enzyme required for sulfatase activity